MGDWNDTPPRILLIEDNPGNARLIQYMLAGAGAETFHCEWVDCLAHGLLQIRETDVDVVLLDLGLPDADGFEALTTVRSHAPDVPIVVLTGRADEALGMQAVHEGAQDYLIKGHVDGDGLWRAVRYAIERSRIAAALRASEERLRLITRHSPDLMFYQDCDLRYREVVNPVPPFVEENVVGKTDDEIFSNDDAERLIRAKQQILRTGSTVSLDIALAVEGTERYYETLFTPHYDRTGKIVGIFGYARDVTQRKKAQQERERLLLQLEAERQWLRTVIDHLPAGVLLLEGARPERVVANRRVQDLFGYPGDAADFAPPAAQRQIFHPNGTPLLFDELPGIRALRGEIVTTEEVTLRQPSGHEVQVLVNATPLRDGEHAIVGAVVVFDDITPLKEMEQLREEWTSMVAHDLRQPVTLISGYASLVAQQQAMPNTAIFQKQVEHIRVSARRLNRMIADLLDASRIEARHLILERQKIDLPAFVHTVVDRMQEMTAGHPVTVNILGDIPLIDADPGRLEQVLGNLLSNAAKYSDADTEIRVSVAQRGTEIRVAVTNQGSGISPEELPHLFSRFYRTHATQSKRIEGLGLGLYIVKNLVEAHGGRIHVDSMPGQTTTFSFSLPLLPDSTPSFE